MSSSEPLVSILLPIYNGEKTISNTIEHLIHQTYKNIEIIAVDDGSTDNTLVLLNDYARTERRLKIFSKKNSGLIDTLNFAIERATGSYLAREDSDDFSNLERIERQVQYMQSNLDIAVCGCDYKIFGTASATVTMSHNASVCAAETLFFPPVSHPSTMIRKRFIDEFGLRYSTKYKHCEDYALWVDIIRHGGKINNLNKVLHNYRNHEKQVSITNSQESTFNHYQLIKEQFAELGVNVNGDLLLHLHYANKEYLNKLNTKTFIEVLWLYEEVCIAYKRANKPVDSLKGVVMNLIEYKIRYALGLRGLKLLLTSGPVIFRKMPSTMTLAHAIIRTTKNKIKKFKTLNT
ncbi:glycosyltransferase family 2 protein [Alteromonas macleodii]|tara:strand:+ start:22310 stop:23353 length:1044 start_codon:yes stop_codon:yes gene_type:complete